MLTEPLRFLVGAVTAAVLVGAVMSVASSRTLGPFLPYNSSNPVMYDNDWSNDYVDWYLMAIASAGDISYRGISTSSPIAPHSRSMPATNLDQQIRLRTNIVAAGRASGFRNIPDPIVGTRGHLVKPASGRIEDTLPLDSPGTRALIAEARNATAAEPLVVCLGGPLTIIADAYLLDPLIADKVVAAWIGGGPTHLADYNGWADGWATYIVLERMRLVQFPFNPGSIPRLTRDWIRANLPDSEVRRSMLALELDVVNDDSGDADGVSILSVRRADYVQATRRVAFAGWTTVRDHEIPMIKADPNGRAIQVTRASGVIASQEYQRAFKVPRAWNPGASAIAHREEPDLR